MSAVEGYANHGHPSPPQGPFYVILEASSSDARSNAARLDAFLTAARAAGSGGVLGGSGDAAKRQQAAAHIWSVRKNLSEGLRLTGGGAPLGRHLMSQSTGPIFLSACVTEAAVGPQIVCSSTT
jgi:hypothetical protein